MTATQNSITDLALNLNEGDVISVMTAGINKPRTIRVTGKSVGECSTMVFVTSGRTMRPNMRGGCIMVMGEVAYYQPTMLQQNCQISALDRVGVAN